MKKLLLIAFFGLASTISLGQLVDETFETDIPVGWTQTTDIDVPWEIYMGVGVDGTNCAAADFTPSSEMGNSWLETPELDLTTLTDPELIFSTAVVRNIFVAPILELWYDTGDGWVYITNWGDEFGGDEIDNPITASNNLIPTLDAENVVWEEGIVFDLADYATFSSIRFAFVSNFQNGGWTLLDDIQISGEEVEDASVSEFGDNRRFSVYPNPSNGVIFIETEHSNIQSVEFVNVLGEQVMNLTPMYNETLISADLSQFKRGVYFISIIDAQNVKHTERFVLN